MDQSFNAKIKQVIFLLLLIGITLMVLHELITYLPGILGAITLYILSREYYFRLIYAKRWGKGRAALIFIMAYTLLLGLPIYLAITLIAPKINLLLNNPEEAIAGVQHVIAFIESKTGFNVVSKDTVGGAATKLSAILPSLFNSTANIITNLSIMLFLLYYMLYSGSNIERALYRNIPLKDENIKLLAAETKTVIKSNAIGIPLIALVQGFTAGIGYWIFGVKDPMLWAFLTGLFSFVPLAGAMLVWVPLCIYLYATGNNGMAIGLALYSAVVTSNIDYFARIGIMKKMGDAHPVITLLGIIVGLSLFGFIGLVFGPLMISYVLVLFEIYMNEFVHNAAVNGGIFNSEAEKEPAQKQE